MGLLAASLLCQMPIARRVGDAQDLGPADADIRRESRPVSTALPAICPSPFGLFALELARAGDVRTWSCGVRTAVACGLWMLKLLCR